MVLVYSYRVKSLDGLLNEPRRELRLEPLQRHAEACAQVEQEVIDGFDLNGLVSATKLANTRMAKSVYDAFWSSFRDKLCYKAITHGATFKKVEGSGSTQSCSACESKDSTTRLKGIAGLRIRE
ncbi:hypothetical protein A9Z05_22090 [Burkholderia sp. A2]|nr:hypothetical protein A9Z05_22090 [Burkholderia sp. A2]